MRKAFSLIELLTVVAIFTLLSPVFARLTFAFVNDVPQSYRTIDENSKMLRILKNIKKQSKAKKIM